MNISEILEQAAALATDWTAEAAVGVASSLKPPQSVIDWDAGAGEAWARVISDYRVVALVSTKLPLVLTTLGQDVRVAVREGVAVIALQSFESSELSCPSIALADVFGSSARLDMLDPESFSANDLWYATV